MIRTAPVLPAWLWYDPSRIHVYQIHLVLLQAMQILRTRYIKDPTCRVSDTGNYGDIMDQSNSDHTLVVPNAFEKCISPHDIPDTRNGEVFCFTDTVLCTNIICCLDSRIPSCPVCDRV